MKQLIPTAVCVLLAASLSAQEHPTEHPTERPTKSSAATSDIDKLQLAMAIEQFVQDDASLKGGGFLVIDDRNGRVLNLSLDKVHKDRLSKVGHDTYFACADFKTSRGKTYDLDIFMQGESVDDLSVTEISVHKENGKARYSWSNRRGSWVKVAAK